MPRVFHGVGGVDDELDAEVCVGRAEDLLVEFGADESTGWGRGKVGGLPNCGVVF